MGEPTMGLVTSAHTYTGNLLQPLMANGNDSIRKPSIYKLYIYIYKWLPEATNWNPFCQLPCSHAPPTCMAIFSTVCRKLSASACSAKRSWLSCPGPQFKWTVGFFGGWFQKGVNHNWCDLFFVCFVCFVLKYSFVLVSPHVVQTKHTSEHMFSCESTTHCEQHMMRSRTLECC